MAKKKSATTAGSMADLARAIGVSRQTISSNWIPAGCPRRADGSFVIADVEKWRDANLGVARPGVENRSELKADILEQELRIKTVRAEQEEVRASEVRGETILRTTVAELLTMRASGYRRRFFELGRRLCRELGPLTDAREIQQRIDNEVNEILIDIQKTGRL